MFPQVYVLSTIRDADSMADSCWAVLRRALTADAPSEDEEGGKPA